MEIPDACTLPTAEQPLRIDEFDEFFRKVRDARRTAPTRLDLLIPKSAEPQARSLAARESQCCTFFAFTFHDQCEDVVMRIDVPATQIQVLDAITARLPA